MADRIRVLFVDDEPDLLELGKLFLEESGEFSVDTASSAADALDCLNHKNYEAVVSDYQMPEMDGIGFLKRVRATDTAISFIIFTGRSREEIVIEALNNGADFYLQKGGDPSTLYTELMHVIRQSVLMRRTQVSLAEQEQRYHDLQNANDLIQSVTPDGHFQFVNKKWLDTLGYQEHELPGLTIFDIIHEESLKHCMDTFQRVISGENVGIIDAVFRAHDGKKVYVEGIASCRMVEGRPQYTRGLFRDVTDRKLAEAALKESEARYRNVVEDQTEFISRFRPDGTYVFVNDAYCRYYHKPREEIIGTRFSPDIPAEDQVLVKQHFASLDHDHPVATITHRIVMPDGRVRWQQWSDRAIFDETGHMQEYQSVGRDITDLKEAELELLRKNEEIGAAFEELTAIEEELRHHYDMLSQKERALRESEVRFRTLIESSPIAVLVAREGRMVYANTEFYRFAGVEKPEEIKGKHLIEFIAPEYRHQVAGYIEAREHGGPAPVSYEAVGLRSDGTRSPFEINVAVIHLADGPASLAFITDISARKKAEEEIRAANEQLAASEEELRGQYEELSWSERHIRESEEKYRTLFNNTSDEVYIHEMLPDGMPGKFLEVNDSMCSRLGYTREELLTMTVHDIVSEEHRKKMAGIGQQVSKTGVCTFYGEHRKKDGSLFPVEINVHRFTFFGKEIILAAARDITERIQAENSLRESEGVFRAIVDQSSEGIIIVDFSGRVKFSNDRARDIIEYPRDKGTTGNFNVLEIISPELRETAVHDFTQVYGGFDSYPVNYKIITLEKKEKWIECIGKKISYKGSHAMLLSFRDITERRKTEYAMEESEKKFRTIFENSPYPISINSIPDGKFIAVNTAFLHSSGYTEEEVIGKSPIELGLLSLLDFGRLSSHMLLAGRLENVPMALMGKEGKRVHVQFSTIPLTINDQPAIMSMTAEVTKLKRVEEELQQKNEELASAFEELTASEEELRQNYDQLAAFQKKILEREARLRTVFEISPEGIILLDLTGRVTFISPEARRMFHAASETEAVGTSVFDWVDPACHERVRNSMVQLLEKKFLRSVTYHARRRDGSSFFIDASHGVFPDENGRPDGFVVIIRDISDRRRAEIALRESEEKFRSIFDLVNDAIHIHEIEPDGKPGKFIEINDVACRMLQYTREELLAHGPLDFVAEYHSRPLDTIIGELSSGGHSIFETEHRRKDGTTIPVEINANVVSILGKRAIISVVRDITERKQAEEALHKANQKLTILSSITRHDINNQLLTLNGFVTLLHKKIPDPSFENYFSNITKASSQITAMIKFTKEYEKIGLHAPVWQNLHTLVHNAGTGATLGQVTLNNDLPANTEVFTDPLIVKVFFNLIDNALRHGSRITTIRFSSEARDRDLIIICEDDGAGIAMPEKEKIFERGFGKNTGFGLAISRDILDITGITIRETGEPGRGARFEITVPQGMWRIIGEGA
jgi:PAS domain S-box-containing protein